MRRYWRRFYWRVRLRPCWLCLFGDWRGAPDPITLCRKHLRQWWGLTPSIDARIRWANNAG